MRGPATAISGRTKGISSGLWRSEAYSHREISAASEALGGEMATLLLLLGAARCRREEHLAAVFTMACLILSAAVLSNGCRLLVHISTAKIIGARFLPDINGLVTRT